MTVHDDAAAVPGLHLRHTAPHVPAAAVRCGACGAMHAATDPADVLALILQWPHHRQECPMSEPLPDHKECRRCGITRPLSEYNRNKRSRDGLSIYCKPCRSKEGADYRARIAAGGIPSSTYAATTDQVAAVPDELLHALEPAVGWRDRAACATTPTRVFLEARHQAKAAKICGSCPVRRDCLEFTLAANPHLSGQVGYYGGTGPAERTLILRARRSARIAAAQDTAPAGCDAA